MVVTDNIHLMASTLDELYEFAKRIGLRREWFQDKLNHPHYDLLGSKKGLAFENGAKLITPKEMVFFAVENYNYKTILKPTK
jgi:hypothetical protein